MKENTTPLENSWRNFRSDVDGAYEKPKDIRYETPNNSAANKNRKITNMNVSNRSSIPKPNGIMHKSNNLGGDKPLGLSKYHNNIPNINKRFKKNEKSARITSSRSSNNIVYNDNQRNHHDYVKLTKNQRQKLSDFEGAVNMSRINLKPVPSTGIKLHNLKNRRLSTELARVISKLAEDNSGAYTVGSDFWDCNRLALRKINRESINKCKISRESHSIIMILDSSPSCSSYANFYGKIAVESAKYGDVDLYDGPNARLVYKYSNKTKEFMQFLTKEDIFADVHRWSLFKNRQIIFFGDEDGINVVQEASVNNIIHYFYTGSKENLEYYFNTYPTHRKLRNINIYPRIRDLKSFIRATRQIK